MDEGRPATLAMDLFSFLGGCHFWSRQAVWPTGRFPGIEPPQSFFALPFFFVLLLLSRTIVCNQYFYSLNSKQAAAAAAAAETEQKGEEPQQLCIHS
jgi:hypothetical protein